MINSFSLKHFFKLLRIIIHNYTKKLLLYFSSWRSFTDSYVKENLNLVWTTNTFWLSSVPYEMYICLAITFLWLQVHYHTEQTDQIGNANVPSWHPVPNNTEVVDLVFHASTMSWRGYLGTEQDSVLRQIFHFVMHEWAEVCKEPFLEPFSEQFKELLGKGGCLLWGYQISYVYKFFPFCTRPIQELVRWNH
jgi:hypothetical protein